MNDFQDRGWVHQAVYRWDGNHGRQGTGMNAVAYSCETERAEELGRELGPLLWVSGAAAARPSVVRTLSRDGDVLLVRRWPTTDPGGRPSTVSHVLIGAPGTLKVRQCLGLAYRGWGNREKAETVTGKQDMVECAQLDAVALQQWPAMVEQLPTVRHALTHAAAEWLRDPTQRMSLRVDEKRRPGWPDQDAVPLVYLGLFLLFGTWLDQEWTFATYDTADTHSLRLMSVPHWEPDTGGSGPLARVMGGRPSDRKFELWAASELVKHLLAHPEQGPGVPQLVKELRGGASLDWERRRARLKEILGPERTSATMPATRDRAGERDQDRNPARELDRAGQPAGPTTATDPYPETPYPETPYAETPYAETPYPETPYPETPYAEQYRGSQYADQYGPSYPPPSPAPPLPPHAPAPSPNGHGPHDAHALHLNLREYRRGEGDGSRRSYLMADLRAQSDELLLHELRQGDLPAESVELVLDELGRPDRIEERDPQTQHQLCACVLRNGLYFTPQGPGAEHTSTKAMVDRAADLFTWAVAPLAREDRYLSDLRELQHRMRRAPHPTWGNWLQRTIFDPPSGQAPDLHPELWSQLLRDALSGRDGRQPAAPQPPRPVQAPTAPPPQQTDVASDPGGIPARLFIGSLLVLGAVLLGLVVMLFLSAG